MSLKYSIETLSKYIKAEASRLGFYAFGIAEARPVDNDISKSFRTWVNNEHYATMDYMANNIEKRLNPQMLMEGVKSIVCVAMNYTPSKRIDKDEYQFASYAYGHDYHDLIKERLFLLVESINNFVGSEKNKDIEDKNLQRNDFINFSNDLQMRVFCDTAPVLERYWAVQAGLGWIGRNHQLIIPGAGSMFFLGELFLNIPLKYDVPMPSHCGNCHACIDACPTKALNDDITTFDANRCLSYQTIENRGEISSDIAKLMGNTIYGCDQCQQACVWNRFAKPTKEPHLQPSEQFLKMKKNDWENLSIDEYRKLFKGSAVKRAKYDGLMRNINIAQENNKNSK